MTATRPNRRSDCDPARSVAALDAIVLEYHQKGKHVEIIGIDEHSARWHALSGTLGNH